jgi:SAM-dependent methyltransferase
MNIYVKYKNIYFKKKVIKYEDELKKIYPIIQFDSEINNKYKNHKITYGEMNYDTLDKIFKIYNFKFNYFIDIGSGRGKLCLFAAKFSNIIKSIGIELVEERHKYAIELKNKLSNFKEIIKVEFINDDFLNVSFNDLSDKNIFIWFSNLCFNENINNDIFNKLICILPQNSIIGCSKKHNINSDKIICINTIIGNMSWSSNCRIILYKII